MNDQAAGQHATPSPIILETRNLKKDFKGFTAINNVNVKVETGSIHALIGPNGAGKTTFFNLLTQFLKPSAGQIIYDGNDITHSRPAGIAQQGLIRSFQISAVFPHLSARENVRIALQRTLSVSYQFWRSKRVLDQLNEEAQSTLELVELGRSADTKAVELPYGQKRALEIATTIALKPRLMLLDEPTQGMSAEDVGTVTDLIRRVVKGRTIVMVEHNLNVVATLADTITVLNRGEVLAEGDYDTVSTNPAVMEAYMGTTDAA
ncbi:amino acid/amide ABC transporter ATP-binding protein 1, HAAT family [Marinobacter sp. DSM 26671]|uniref:ABC transporter ATP-binding protein n=1 Tax=Marinobacter sp. DSM 26671 TaxID=1761793 RepID=UPI0008EA78B3|nr:ABC transporter ATP-binding protein [Marinobacter sp. DSM 26671]SFE18419.1 amino acid/amide ABC transporter ATP-binding protein 1, HAAT family [Marinobacter sp. DSM 26671]